MLSNILTIYAACVFAVAYVVRILLYAPETTQPFLSKREIVRDGLDNGAGETSEHLVGLFDRFRRLFGAYRVEDVGNDVKIWHTTIRMDLWRCPKCLSFWASFFVSAPFCFSYTEWYLFPIVHLSIVFLSQFLVFLQLAIEGE